MDERDLAGVHGRVRPANPYLPSGYLHFRQRGGGTVEYLVWGDERFESKRSLELRAQALGDDMQRCGRREAAIAWTGEALDLASTDPIAAFGRLAEGAAAWTEGHGTGAVPGRDEACSAIEEARVRIPEGTWRELDLAALRRGLRLETRRLCRQGAREPLLRAEATEATVARLREIDAFIDAGRLHEASTRIERLQASWDEASAVDPAEVRALGERVAALRHSGRTQTAEAAVAAVEEQLTLAALQAALPPVRMLGADAEQERMALLDRLARLEPAWVLKLRGELDSLSEPMEMLVLRDTMLAIARAGLEELSPTAGRDVLALAAEAEARAEDLRFEQLFPVRDGVVHLGSVGVGFRSEATRLYDLVATGDAGMLGVTLMPSWAAKHRAEQDPENGQARCGLGEPGYRTVVERAAASPEVQEKLQRWRARLAPLEYVVEVRSGATLRSSGSSRYLSPWGDWPLEGGPWTDFEKLQLGSLYPWQFSGVSVGLWRRLRWSTVGDEVRAEVELSGLSRALGAALEQELGRGLTPRWRWKGFGKPTTRRAVTWGSDDPQEMTWQAPGELRLELVDAEGQVVWSLR